jgi:hypothetical protein
MLVILGLSLKDIDAGLRLLEWITELGEVSNHDLLLIFDGAVDARDSIEAMKRGSEAFNDVATRVTPHVDGWIAGSNTLFKEAALCAEERGVPFLWMESDAIPLKPSWLNDLDTAYAQCGRPFMGAFLKANKPSFPSPFMEGVAIYPKDCWQRFKPVWNDDKMLDASLPNDMLRSWVVLCSPVSVREGVNTPLIQQIWGENMGIAVDFVATRTIHSAPQDWTLENISPNAVLFHRTKTDSLIRLLRGRLFADKPDYTNPPCFVQMGRFGDLILLLPAFQAWAERSGRKTPVVTSKEFGNVLEGVSYVTPIQMKYTWFEAGLARNWAQMNYRRVIVTQLHGSDIPTIPDDLPSYSFSMWKRTELLDEYHSLPVVFDQRSREREQVLIDAYSIPKKPIILTKFDGWTSPFDGAAHIKNRLTYWQDHFQFIDLDKIRAHRIYDLLGLLDIATGLITGDTFTIHLAAASQVQYIAYTRDDGQSGSIPKACSQCVLQIGYSQWEKRMNAFDLQCELWARHPKLR